MMLLETVVSSQEHFTCRRCASCGHDVVLQEEFVAMPHDGSANCWDKATCCPVFRAGPATLPRPPVPAPDHTKSAALQRPRKRKSGEEAGIQRRNHIAVERNRRRQMNEYLAELRSIMPPSYARRGDQTSIVEGAINFVKQLEQHLQSLQAHKRRHAGDLCQEPTAPFAGFFTHPHYSATAADVVDDDDSENCSCARPGVADIEVAVSEGHAAVKMLASWRPRQLLKMLLALHNRGLAVLHLNITTTADKMVFYTVSLSIGDGCQLSSAGEVSAAIHDIVTDINLAQDTRAC